MKGLVADNNRCLNCDKKIIYRIKGTNQHKTKFCCHLCCANYYRSKKRKMKNANTLS